jgi:hypothetical protein
MATRTIVAPDKHLKSFGSKGKKKHIEGKTTIIVGKGSNKKIKKSFLVTTTESLTIIETHGESMGLNQFMRKALNEDIQAQLSIGNSVIIVEDDNIVEKWAHKSKVLVEGIKGTSRIDFEKESKPKRANQGVAVT